MSFAPTTTSQTPSPRLTLGVLGSGSGTNLQSILDAIDAGTLSARVGCVISDVPGAGILERARRHGCPAWRQDCAPFKTKLEGPAEAAILSRFRETGVDTVVLAGFMRMVKPGLLNAFPGRVLNIHPSLLPAFPGLCAWRQALDYGVRFSGCTVHFVDPGMDSGPIILQRVVPVDPSDTPESLHARIQVEEHRAYPEALRLLAAGRLEITGRKVRILPG